MVDGMVIKMSRNRCSRHIVCRMLYRSKRINLLAHRKNNDTSRMLSGRSPDADTSLYNTVNLTVSLVNSALFIIIFDISKCSLVRKCTNRSGTERLSVTENNLTVSMGFTLILTGKV